jgi:(R,R)-butanediol dehydrogenase/meso-butanediol dehydrogenase/diacetyl reductase
MKAALWYAKKDIRVENVSEPIAEHDEVVIKVKRAGICGTDLHDYLHGPKSIPTEPHPLTGHKAPIIMGHEVSGVVYELGKSVEDISVGDRVTIMPLQHCGKCYYCVRGMKNLCKVQAGMGLQWYWGGFSDFCKVKAYQINKIPDNMDFSTAALVEPTALAMYGIKRSKLQAGDTVLITGGGPTAVLTMMSCFAAGAAAVYTSEVQPGRLKKLKEYGATEAFNPLETNLREEILNRTEGIGVDIAIECTGVENAINDCFSLLRNRGTYVQSGLSIGQVRVSPWEWALKDINLVGLWCYNIYDFPKIINLIKAEKLPVESIITRTIKLDNIVESGFEALTANKEGSELKIQVSME